MKSVATVAMLTLMCSVACAKKPAPAPTPTATNNGGAGTTQATGRGAGAQAAARLTADDLDARMKVIGPASGALRTKLMANQLADAATDAQTLATAFGDVERFFQQNNKSDAVMWAQQARMRAQEAAGAATAGDGMKATAAAGNMQATCKQCHATYREGDAQSGYRVKTGTLLQ